MKKRKIQVSWSGGKDCLLALRALQLSEKYEVAGLHTTLNSETRRVGMHGIPAALIAAQAASLGLPWERIMLPADTDNDSYEAVMYEFCRKQISQGITAFAYGDILLEDLKQYRERQLEPMGIAAVFPLWNRETNEVVQTFIQEGFKAIVCCADKRFFGKDVLGVPVDHDFIAGLPEGVDVCGENGEFHTFAYDGPLFRWPVSFVTGEKILKHYPIRTTDGREEQAGFWFQDLRQS